MENKGIGYVLHHSKEDVKGKPHSRKRGSRGFSPGNVETLEVKW